MQRRDTGGNKMLKTFLVEDEVVVRETIKKMIPWEEHGFCLVGEAADGEMALPLIRKTKPDLLITDIKMPFMDGLTLARMVKKDMPEIRIVILSGYDDFNYAKQAIGIGVEDYLLKPITKKAFIERLEEIRSHYEKQQDQKAYYEKFYREIQAYEKNSSRDFFEALVSGRMNIGEIYERAERLGIDIAAEAYNIIIFTLDSEENALGRYEGPSGWENQVHEKIENLFLNHEYAMLFRNTAFSYAVLIRGNREDIEEKTDQCINELWKILDSGDSTGRWFLAAGEPVERLSGVKHSYHAASRAFARRYFAEDHVMRYQSVKQEEESSGKNDLQKMQQVDVNALNPAILQKFLGSGLLEETDEFVKNYFRAIGTEPMQSLVFRNYVVLNVRFSVLSFLKKLDAKLEEKDLKETEQVLDTTSKSMEAAVEYSENLIRKAIELRDENTGNQSRGILKDAMEYINEHYMDEEISLNVVAGSVNVSSNHFSALFSQNMGQTFSEKLTSLRMEKARELLRCTALRSSEIAGKVGYKDAHYFSYIFKKTQGMTPSDYRKASASAERSSISSEKRS